MGAVLTGPLLAGPYAPAAGSSGSTAMIFSHPDFVAWASGVSAIAYGANVDSQWKTPALALGPAKNDRYDIVCLGNGGVITMIFPHPIRDGEGGDFAVFENGFGNTFLELAFVEVSSDGIHFYRFPNDSLTPAPVGGFGGVDPTNLSGLAGKYRGGYGTPFDLADLPDEVELDKQNVRFVRIVDIVGDGSATDSEGKIIYDPYPTTGSGGFDLEAIGVIHQNDGEFKVVSSRVTGGNFEIRWESNPGSVYRIDRSTDLEVWEQGDEFSPELESGITSRSLPMSGPKCFWRVVRVP